MEGWGSLEELGASHCCSVCTRNKLVLTRIQKHFQDVMFASSQCLQTLYNGSTCGLSLNLELTCSRWLQNNHSLYLMNYEALVRV